MKVSLNWLKERVDLPAEVATLCDLLTRAGVEVEGIEQSGVAIDKVVVAQILESNPHPGADRLSVCRVDDGSGEPRQIVCGAKNYKVGDKVPLALPGAVLPGDFKIKVGKLRGVQSEGMMCSAKELQVAEDAAGLLILSPGATVGAPISSAFPSDTVLDLEVTPNRPDLLSYTGMAREVATLLKQAFRTEAETPFPAAASGEIVLEAAEACPFYSAHRITGVKVAPSPEWLVRKLEASGLRPINNVVDVTNLVMLETGQPLHAFDVAKLSGPITVRKARADEKLLALDGREYTLGGGDLVIADGEKAQAIAGVMGGEESGVTETTTDLLLESAWFQPAGVRRTSRRLALSTDSSYRFERSVDPAGVLAASAQAVRLIVELAGGEAAAGVETVGTLPQRGGAVPFRLERCRAILGTEVERETADAILSGFGLTPSGDGWIVPSFRPDLTREIDLIEEIARVIGIDAVPAREQARFTGASEADQWHDRAMRLRRHLAGEGFREARSLTLISERALAQFPAPEVLRVRNPLSEDEVILRPSLLPGLLTALTHNLRNGSDDVRLFELGRTFLPVKSPKEREERTALAWVMTGGAVPASWRDAKPREADLFDLKAVVLDLLPLVSRGGVTLEPTEHPALALAFEVRFGRRAVGIAGQLLPARARELDATAPVLVAEIDLDAFALRTSRSRFVELPKFPAVTRDIAMLVPRDLPHGAIEAALLGAKEEWLAKVELFDVFTDPAGEKIPADKKSVAYALTYRSSERTLTADEAMAVHERLKARLKSELAKAAGTEGGVVEFRE
ncbi:MAG TPA: phenylalanine--tRNA ligase subunit beta [Chthoniobacteraceae bacterium]|nr:phenylalanine--tRNA ligase subunit beta [Chthoniobacteraceae bacterium]